MICYTYWLYFVWSELRGATQGLIPPNCWWRTVVPCSSIANLAKRPVSGLQMRCDVSQFHPLLKVRLFCWIASLFSLSRVPTLHEELNSPTFPDHACNSSRIKLTCDSYFSLHFSRLLLPYTDSLCYHYHILNHWEWKGTETWRK